VKKMADWPLQNKNDISKKVEKIFHRKIYKIVSNWH
jgi:hypothetical protein